MTEATTISGGTFLVLLGDGASPEVFTAPCGLTTRGFNQTKAVNETIIPDCADPDAATWAHRDAASFSGSISGAGLLAMESIPAWQAFFSSNASKSVKIQCGGAGHWTGKFHCTKFEVGGENKKRATVSIELQSDGIATWVDDT